ncbi:WD40 repeat-like protein [Apiospora rasikravindrae]|uniref:WD40 repeat-like protein n=1 Tax=Apiospora rasikravindrae TaxID=990691 RepID=A0ABR1RRB4_9PEZI
MLSSSPPHENAGLLSSPPRRNNGKERKNPSITPRKFKRFFTPRSSLSSHITHISPARRALKELAGPQVNNRYQTPAPSSPLQPPDEGEEDLLPNEDFTSNFRSSKRRKFHHTPESSPCRPEPLDHGPIKPSPVVKPALLSPIGSLQSSQDIRNSQESDDKEEEEEEEHSVEKPVKRLAPLTARGLGGQRLQREFGTLPKAGYSRPYMSCSATDWRMETSAFYSHPEDVHSCTSQDGVGRCIPFCTTACHTNSLVAVGDEEGQIRLLDSSGDPSSETFSKVHLSFQAHSNAIIDLDFSADDSLIATASGDQTGRVIDMMTQSTVAVLLNHTASLKQVRFQPGQSNNSVLATSSRDGSVQIWDLRCRGPVQDIPALARYDNGLAYRLRQPKNGCVVNSLYHAHARTQRQVQQAANTGPGDTPSRGELPGRIGDVSVTALQFLPEGREHLLLTACEADASIKLWDIRSSTRKGATALSTTAPPTSHSRWRPFGVSSLSLNTDSTRLYALSKDNTVYAYSTAHLILGHAPELSSQVPRRRHGATHNGLGPMYGFRHPSLHATSFYVKAAVRPASHGSSEMLAVGSSDACAVVFPTEERYFEHDLAELTSSLSLSDSTIAGPSDTPKSLPPSQPDPLRRALFQRSSSSTNLAAKSEKDDIPIVRNGTPLVRGHDREVGALSWTNKGKLVTVGDDYLVRCWHEGREQARDLRVNGEGGGRRWGCGWAQIEDWSGDQSDDDEE